MGSVMRIDVQNAFAVAELLAYSNDTRWLEVGDYKHRLWDRDRPSVWQRFKLLCMPLDSRTETLPPMGFVSRLDEGRTVEHDGSQNRDDEYTEIDLITGDHPSRQFIMVTPFPKI